jgi:hypothetical protein
MQLFFLFFLYLETHFKGKLFPSWEFYYFVNAQCKYPGLEHTVDDQMQILVQEYVKTYFPPL